jgi:hypothetical protein
MIIDFFSSTDFKLTCLVYSLIYPGINENPVSERKDAANLIDQI